MASPDTFEKEIVASVVFAAGKGSRMTGYTGNKTLLPLISRGGLFEGERPLLIGVLSNLPPGPRCLVVNHCADAVRQATAGLGCTYLYQEVTNGTGGALLAAHPFLESTQAGEVIITMGDVPLIRHSTYARLRGGLRRHPMVVLAFSPRDRARYGMLEMDGERAMRIVEWKYWREFSADEQARLRYCNAGVYAVRRDILLPYLERMASTPHRVEKERDGKLTVIEEYFLTDLVEWMSGDGLTVGVVEASEEEVMGVDTPEALRTAQDAYSRRSKEIESAHVK